MQLRTLSALFLCLWLAAGCADAATLRPVASPASPLISPPLATWRGETAYAGKPLIELAYNTATWRYVDDPDEPALVHTTLDPCTLTLRRGSSEAVYVGELDLGAWRWLIHNNGPNFPDLLYYTALLNGYAAGIALQMPPIGATTERSACMAAAEAVLATFASEDPAVNPTGDASTPEEFFAVDDAAGWPVIERAAFSLRLPPGWGQGASQANVGSRYWQFQGILPTSLAEHFQVRPSVWVIIYDNPERLPLADWVERQPPYERAVDAIESHALTIGTHPALTIKTRFAGIGDAYLATWTPCGAAIALLSTGGALRADLQDELEQVYTLIVGSFRCMQNE
ncbi:MAG: hypothetical protein WAU00_17010 [Caldilinea sp.]